MNQQAQILAQYVNPREGKRPPSIKDSNGVYYTLSDAAYQMLAPSQGQVGNIGFWVNDRGYNQATHWNGAELPKDQRRGAPPMQQAPQAPQQLMPQPPMPGQAPAPALIIAPPPDNKGMDIFLTGVVQQAMSTGKFGVDDIAPLALAVRDAWEAAHKPTAATLPAMPDGRPEAPLDDGIPY